jgi:hypothetical protein
MLSVETRAMARTVYRDDHFEPRSLLTHEMPCSRRHVHAAIHADLLACDVGCSIRNRNADISS